MFNPTINLNHSQEALDALPPELRQAINLSYFSGFTTTQVAGLLGITVEVVEQRLEAGLTALAA